MSEQVSLPRLLLHNPVEMLRKLQSQQVGFLLQSEVEKYHSGLPLTAQGPIREAKVSECTTE